MRLFAIILLFIIPFTIDENLGATNPALHSDDGLADGSRVRIAIVSFTNHGKSGGERLAQAAKDHLYYSLSKSNTVDLYEREELDKVLAEQNLHLTGAIDPKTAVEIGKLVGVSHVLIGSITETQAREGGFSLLGMAGYKSYRVICSVQARLVSVETGKVDWIDSGKGKKRRMHIHVMGIGGGSSYGTYLLDEAVKKAIRKLSASLIANIKN